MKILDREGWDKGLAANQDAYGGCVYRYAEAWADEMEKAMKLGARLEDVTERLAQEVDRRPNFGITGFMYGAAVSLLSQAWEHGEALRRWHNLKTQIGNEGEQANESGAVLNPALLKIGK